MPDINGKTLLVGLLATPIRHSNSPRMQSEAFAMTGVNCVQLAFEVGNEQLEDAVKGLRALGAVGFNVSMPNKRMVTQYLDELSTAAALSGSVNTVVNDNGKLIGHNTDGYGFWESLRRNNIEFVGKKATLIGPGGVGAAICVQGALDGLGEIAIFTQVGKSEKTAKELVEKINANTSCKAAMYMVEDEAVLREQIADSDLFINATGVGMGSRAGESVITDGSMFRPELTVCDVIYAPLKTKLLEIAEQQGCRILNGLDMMLCQGAKGFDLWTGKTFPMEEIRAMFF